MSERARLRDLGRLAALGTTALALLATSYPPCQHADRASFDADTSCGPAGVVTLSYAETYEGCSQGYCWAFVEADGASAVGLPVLGEIHPEWEPPDPDVASSPLAPGAVFVSVPFALVGDAPLAGSVPPASVRRVCRATPSSAGVVALACDGDAQGAACAGTLTLRPEQP